MVAKKEINFDDELKGESSSLIIIRVKSLSPDDITDEDREGWITDLTKYIYMITRKVCPEDRDITVEVTLNEKGNADHLRN